MTPFPTDPYEQFNTFTYRDRYMGYNDFFFKKKRSATCIVLHDYHFVYCEDFIAL